MSKERFWRKLKEQIGYLKTSADSFDAGLEAEAIRLATTLRVLFHSNPDTKNVSVLKHLKMDTSDVLSTAPPKTAQYLDFVRINLNLSSPTPVKAVPKLGNQFYPVPLNDWWAVHPVYGFNRNTYTRAAVVRAAANQDGGAHVDSKVAAFYADMEAGTQGLALNGQNLVYPNDQAPFDKSKPQQCQNIHYALLRQFAHEVLATSEHYKWLQ